MRADSENASPDVSSAGLNASPPPSKSEHGVSTERSNGVDGLGVAACSGLSFADVVGSAKGASVGRTNGVPAPAAAWGGRGGRGPGSWSGR